jgi:hypothetical protein
LSSIYELKPYRKWSRWARTPLIRWRRFPTRATIGATMVEQAKARDEYLLENGLTGPLPQCTICGQELALPFRKAGAHPECAFDMPGESLR